MSQSEARSWWADVEHLREAMERRGGAGLRAVEPTTTARDGDRAEPAADFAPVQAPRPAAPRSRFAAESWLDDSDLEAPPAARFDRSTTALGEEPVVDDWLDEDRPDGPEARSVDVWLDESPPLRTGRFDRTPGAERSAALSAVPSASPTTQGEVPARRTVRITGQATPAPAIPRVIAIDRRRPLRRPSDRVGPRPDRVALWAVMLAFFLILVAALSSAVG